MNASCLVAVILDLSFPVTSISTGGNINYLRSLELPSVSK